MSGRRRPVRPPEVEGFFEGVAHRLARLRRDGRPDLEGDSALMRASEAMKRGNWPAAEEELLAVAARLDANEPEQTLSEWPRGLVDYAAKGSRGEAPSREEERISNRLLLVQRLLVVRRAQGREVDTIVPVLESAERAYRSGDRALARRLVDEAHARLEQATGPGEH